MSLLCIFSHPLPAINLLSIYSYIPIITIQERFTTLFLLYAFRRTMTYILSLLCTSNLEYFHVSPWERIKLPLLFRMLFSPVFLQQRTHSILGSHLFGAHSNSNKGTRGASMFGASSCRLSPTEEGPALSWIHTLVRQSSLLLSIIHLSLSVEMI